MKKTLIPIILLLMILSFLIFVPEINSIMNEDNFIVGAHRGSSIKYTENTLEAIDAALQNNEYRFIEFDVRYTKDKYIVLHHDNSLFRNHLSFQEISELNYSELENYTDYHVPQLEEILELVNNKKKIIIEIKSTDNLSLDKELTDSIMDLINQNNISHKNVMISSISQDITSYVENKYPQYKTGTVFWVLPISYVDSDELVKEFYLNISSDYILLHNINLRNYENLIEFKPENKTLLFWTFEDRIYLLSEVSFWE